MQGLSATHSPSVQQAWQLLQLRRPELALRVADQLLARDPASAPALLARTEALLQLKRLPEAVEAAQQAVGLVPLAAGAHAALARAYGQQGELYEAELAIREAVRLNPTVSAYFAFLAELQYLLHRPAEAASSAKNGLFLNPEHADCLLWQALAQEQLRQPEAADAAFSRLLHVSPTSDLAHAKLGQVLLRRYEAAAAHRHLSEALRQAPSRAPQLLPLLRQARRQWHWPAWLVQRRQQLRHEWQARQALSWRGGQTLLLLPFFWVAGHWRTRHDPLFRPSRRQVWQRWQLVWLFSFLLIPVLILGGDYLGLLDADKPFSLPQMVGLLIGGLLFQLVLHLMKRKIDSLET